MTYIRDLCEINSKSLEDLCGNKYLA